MSRRRFLENSIRLAGDSDGVPFRRTFTILKMIAEGASTVSYEAYHQKSGRGVLKEFYPENAYGAERDPDGELILSPEFGSAGERFLKEEEEYIEPYNMLLKLKQESGSSAISTFIPAFEIYYGCDESGNKIGTSYIWTPQPELYTFDKICDDIHAHPDENPEHKLVTALSALINLTQCVRALHGAGLVHSDIKPSNFGFLMRNGEPLPETISLFDIDSVRSVFGKYDTAMGSEGYMEPEAGLHKADNKTDIFSIGAVLFNALIVTDESRSGNFVYRPEYYGHLREMVDTSDLICASEANSHPRLRNLLTKILNKCLAPRSRRYESCEELLEDMHKALYYALPSDIAKESLEGEKWVLADAEKLLDKNKEKDSFLAIQYHLYRHPLYELCPKDGKNINILIFGFGNYGQKFLDACLQSGQMPGKKLNVTVVSGDPDDKRIYLMDRPQLPDFFNIDGSLKKMNEQDVYGNIEFVISGPGREKHDEFQENMRKAVKNYDVPGGLQYIFIALGNDDLNLAAAKEAENAAKETGTSCVISFICENRKHMEEHLHFYPLYINEKVSEMPFYSEIERMAFNVHLLWEKNWNIDFSKIKAAARKRYNHDADVSAVLSLKYKLYGAGIDIDDADPAGTAREYKMIISDRQNRLMRNELMAAEHRRWVSEKLCRGWRTLDDLEECAGGVTKDTRRKRHICIVRGRADRKLAAYKKNGKYDKWDTASDAEIEELDDLDRVSLRLHRMYMRHAETARRQDLLGERSMSHIKGDIDGDKKAKAAFEEWYSCLKDISDGNAERVNLYRRLKTSFLNAASSLPEQRKKALEGDVKAFETRFYPILASQEYRDYKQEDLTIIDNIPFVLTYTEKAALAVPLRLGSPSAVFDNIAAACAVNPEKIFYLCLAENEADAGELRKAVPCVTGYMRKNNMRAALEFRIIAPDKISGTVNADYEKELIRLGGGKVRQAKVNLYHEEDEIADIAESYLTRRSAGKAFFAVEKNMTRLSGILLGAGIYNLYSNYKFDPGNMSFYDFRNASMLRFIPNKPCMTVADMTAFGLSISEHMSQPEFYSDYRDLWNEYDKNPGIWKELCGILEENADETGRIASFRKKTGSGRSETSEKYEYLLPLSCAESAGKILAFLINKGIIEEGSGVSADTSDSCKAVIFDSCRVKRDFDGLFRQVGKLSHPGDIDINYNEKTHTASVTFDSLEAESVNISGPRRDELAGLLEYFGKKRYLIGLDLTNDRGVRFAYASKQIKQLLTAAGRILEVYVYHKARELGCFDDVVSGYEISWQGSDVKSELDLVATRGFQSLFVECKARPQIEQEFYFKLLTLAQKFGIHATAVLIIDTREKSYYDTAAINEMQRMRGDMLDVVTIWKPEEIKNIGHTLLSVINGKYRNR